MKVTERAVIFVGTVSRALNNDIRVAPDARDHIFVVLCELGCAPNLVKSRVDRFLPIPLRKLADYIGTLTDTSFPLVSIDHQGIDSLCADVGTRYGVPAIAFPFALEGTRNRHACRIYI